MTVIVVEDQQEVRHALVRLMGMRGWSVAGAGNGAQAKVLLTELSPRCVVLDHMLPDTDGVEILRWLRGRRSDVGVVMYSAAEDAAAERAAAQLGAEWVKKAGNPGALFETIKRVCPSGDGA